jgi:hypothetical protein
MPVNYHILPEHNLVYIAYSGMARIEDSFDCFAAFSRDPMARAGQKHFVDLSAITGIEDDFPRLFALQAEKAGRFMNGIGPSVLLYYAPTPVSYVMARTVLRSWEGLDGPVIVVQQDEVEAFSLIGLPELRLADLSRPVS